MLLFGARKTRHEINCPSRPVINEPVYWFEIEGKTLVTRPHGIEFRHRAFAIWTSVDFYVVVEHVHQVSHFEGVGFIVGEMSDTHVQQYVQSRFTVVDEAVACRFRIRCQMR